MDPRLYELLCDLRLQANEAYWDSHNDCGGDFDEKACLGGDNGPCHTYSYCQRDVKLNAALEVINQYG